MFTVEQRASLRATLLHAAAAELEDRWSDIDLAFGGARTAEKPDVMRDWTARMYDRHGALHQDRWRMDLSGLSAYRRIAGGSGICSCGRIPGALAGVPTCLRDCEGGVAISVANSRRHHRDGVAACGARADLHCARKVVAGGVHDQRRARPRAHAGMSPARIFRGARSRF